MNNLGIAPVGHRVTISTPEYIDIDITMPVTPSLGATIGQIEPIAQDITDEYIKELVQSVFDTWERTYFANEGIENTVVGLSNDIDALNTFMVANEDLFTGGIAAAYSNMQQLLNFYPADRIVQTHDFEVLFQPQILGVRILQSELVNAVDFENILINGAPWLSGYPIHSNQDTQLLPRLRTLEIIEAGS